MRLSLLLFFTTISFYLCGYTEPENGQGFRHGFGSEHRLKDLKIDVWDSRTGMVSNNVTSVFQAKDDHLWITSYNGLQRFDGIEFRAFDQTDIPFIRSGTFNETTQDQDGVLWFATGASGLVGFDGVSFFEHPLKDSLPISILTVLSDSQNNLWIGSTSRGLFKLGSDGSFNKIENTPTTSVYNIYEDSKNNVWVAFDSGGIFRITGDDIVIYEKDDNGLNWDLINATIVEHKNVVYIGSGGGVHMIEGNQVSSLASFKGAKVGDITVDDYGFLWASTNNGLARYHINKGTFELLTVDEGLPSDRIVDLFFDNEGSLWISSYEAGLIRLKTSRITTMTTRNGLSSNKVSVVDIHEGKFFIGNQNGAVDVYDGEEVFQLELDPAFGTDVIRDFMFEDDVVWVASYDGLLRIQGENQEFYDESSGLPSIGFRRIFKDSKGTIWLGSRNGGLIRFDPEGNHETFDVTNGTGPNYVLDIDEDSQGNLVIGTNTGGLVIKEGDELKRYHLVGEDAATLIFGVSVRSDNIIWLCTNFGLYYFKNEEIAKVELYPTVNIEKFFDIIFDEIGGVWLTSEKGVYNIKQNNLKKFINGKIDKVPYVRFGVGDGMESEECTGATRSVINNETEKIWIPTFEGVSVITPGERPKNKKKPKVLITGLHIDHDLLIPTDQYIEVNPGAFRYVFDVTALSYLGPASVQFRYKLEGIDEEWSEPTHKRSVQYTNLPHGKYVLRVIASNNDGVWNTKGASLEFAILPFFYETWQFKIGMVLLIIAIARLAYVWRTRNIKATNRALSKMNNELDRFVYSASHDLRGPLTSVMGLVDLGLTDTSPDSKDRYFELIRDCNKKMDDFIRELINYSKNKNDKVVRDDFSIKAAIDKVIKGLDLREPSHGVTFHMNIECHDTFRGDQTRLKVVLRNILHNAIVFSDKEKKSSEVSIYVIRVNHEIRFIITDNGIGISKNNYKKIFDMFYRSSSQSKGAGLGLYVAHQTCLKLKGQIKVNSVKGEWSEFTVSLPVH